MNTLILILKLIPSIIAAVKAAEEFVPLPGQGKAKLDMILGIISDVYDDAKSIAPLIAKAVARIVELANAAGVFKKS